MFNDPIVAETRKLREEYAARFDFDLAAICRDLREQQARGERLIVTRQPHPPQNPPQTSGQLIRS